MKYFIFFGMIFIFLALAFNGENSISYDELRSNLTTVNNDTFTFANNFKYTNLYEEEITFNKVIMNVIHPIVYTVVVEANTLLPVSIHLASSGIAGTIMTIIIIYFILCILFNIPQLIKNIIAIYFFVKEKKKYKEKWWE